MSSAAGIPAQLVRSGGARQKVRKTASSGSRTVGAEGSFRQDSIFLKASIVNRGSFIGRDKSEASPGQLPEVRRGEA